MPTGSSLPAMCAIVSGRPLRDRGVMPPEPTVLDVVHLTATATSADHPWWVTLGNRVPAPARGSGNTGMLVKERRP